MVQPNWWIGVSWKKELSKVEESIPALKDPITRFLLLHGEEAEQAIAEAEKTVEYGKLEETFLPPVQENRWNNSGHLLELLKTQSIEAPKSSLPEKMREPPGVASSPEREVNEFIPSPRPKPNKPGEDRPISEINVNIDPELTDGTMLNIDTSPVPQYF